MSNNVLNRTYWIVEDERFRLHKGSEGTSPKLYHRIGDAKRVIKMYLPKGRLLEVRLQVVSQTSSQT
jgi:hypothetical protein